MVVAMTDTLCPTCRSPLRFARAIFSPATGDYGEIWRCTNCGLALGGLVQGRDVEQPDDVIIHPCACDCGCDAPSIGKVCPDCKHGNHAPPDDPEAPDTMIVDEPFRDEFMRRGK